MGIIEVVFLKKLVMENLRWWRPLYTGMKTIDVAAGDVMKITVVDETSQINVLMATFEQ